MEEGVFVGWLKKHGESVKAHEPLFTLEGDKAAQDIEATDDGILNIPPESPKAGETVSVGAVLGYLVEEGELVVMAKASPPSPSEQDEPAAAASATNNPRATVADSPSEICVNSPRPAVTISPRARQRAKELGVDWISLKGSGQAGRITEADVLVAAQPPPDSSASTMRRLIAQRTAESFTRAPHFYLRTEVDATALLELRQRLLPAIEQEAGIRVTLTDLLLRAHALALRDCPHANAIWQDNGIVQFKACDIGLVVGLSDGLRVPIIRDADKDGLTALVRQRASLVESARAGKLAAEAMQGGATSLSNLGNGCVDEFAAVISPRQSSMLAVGRAVPRPFVIGEQLVIRTTLILCLSVDHRVMDGGPAAEFLARVAELVGHPTELARTES